MKRAIQRYTQWFGSYNARGELKKVQAWLTVNDGQIEFLTGGDSYKVKRVRRNPRAVCFLGKSKGSAIPGTAAIVADKEAIWRTYRAYWKTHPLPMVFLAFPISRRIRTAKEVLIRVRPDEPNPVSGVTHPVL